MELIGMLFGAIVFFILCMGLGGVSASVAWLLLRGRPRVRLMMGIAGVVPALCGIYMVACLISFSGGDWGDIDEPLPHGYSLRALGKMPDYGTIARAGDDSSMLPATHGWIDTVDLEGDTLFGTYNHGDDEAGVQPVMCCFAFNTATGSWKDFASHEEMNAFAGKTIKTEEVQYFRSREPATVRMRRVEKWIFFTPPALVVLMLSGLLLWWRMTTSPEPA